MNAVKTRVEIRVGDALIRPITDFGESQLPQTSRTTGVFTPGGRRLDASLSELDADIKQARQELRKLGVG